MHDSGGCIVHLLNLCNQIGPKLAHRCLYVPDWIGTFGDRCMDTRTHAGPLLAQFEPSSSQGYRERFVDTMLRCTKTERLGVQYLVDYSAKHCNFLTLRLTN